MNSTGWPPVQRGVHTQGVARASSRSRADSPPGRRICRRRRRRSRLLVLLSRGWVDSHGYVTLALARFSQKGMIGMHTETQSGPTRAVLGGLAAEGMDPVLTAEPIAIAEPSCETNLLNLLVVDDERSMRESCREVARALGFNTQVADSSEHAFSILDSTKVDVVLLDLRLPGNHGLDVLRQIKERHPEILVVLMTGFATVESAVRAMKLGAYDYITKPFNFDELRMVLERVTAHLKLTSENRLLRE